MLTKKPLLRNFFLSLSGEERAVFADACNTSPGQIEQIYRGYRSCNETLAIEIDKHSNGAVPCDVLCPATDFNYLRNKAEQHQQEEEA